MIIYTIDAYSKADEELLFEIEVPENNFDKLSEIMELDDEDKADFSHGIGVYDINKKQALLLEKLVGREFYSGELTLQLSGGEA